MDNKFVFFAFNGNLMCFMHVLLNALDLEEKGKEARIVIEGESVKLIKELEESKNPLYLKAKAAGLITEICKACSNKLGVLEYNMTVGIPVTGEMTGHPPMEKYISEGYKVITL